MKRTPLQRKTPLVARTPLARGTCELRRTPISPMSAKRRGMGAQRVRVVNALRLAQNGRCLRCGHAGLVLHGHELLGMAQGGDYLQPDVALCDPCNGAIEDDPVVSAWNGWKISSKHPHDPALPLGTARDLHGNIVVFADLEVTA